MKKTKIICTLGPSTETIETIQQLIENGMDCARLNASHGNHEEKLKKIDILRDLSRSTAIMLDTKGPEIRTGDADLVVEDGEEITLTNEEVEGTKDLITIRYDGLLDIEPNQTIYLDDGLIELEALEITDKVKCKIISGGILKSNKTVAFPGLKLSIDSLTKQDIKDIEFALKYNLDFIAASFVKTAADIQGIRSIIDKKGSRTKIIAKIETLESVKNIEQIIEVSDGIMVARGDLAVEIQAENVPLVQKDIIRKCNNAGKPVIVATQMLQSMITSPKPTRAEINDIANAILDGTDAVMLSGETANGKYPLLALKQMASTALAVEPGYIARDSKIFESDSISSFISQSVYQAVDDLGIDAIITPTSSGYTARLISRYKPKIPIIAITASLDSYRQLQLSWGIIPVLGKFAAKSRQIVVDSILLALEKELINRNDTIIVTAGIPVGQAGTTNLVEIHKIEQFISYYDLLLPKRKL